MRGRDAAKTLPGLLRLSEADTIWLPQGHRVKSGGSLHCPALLILQPPELPLPHPAPLILFVGILSQAKPCRQRQMLLPSQLLVAVSEGGGGAATLPQHPIPSLALPRRWEPEAESNNGPGQAGWAGGQEMTRNWPCPSPVIHLFIQQTFTKSLLWAGPAQGPPEGCAVSTMGLSQTAYLPMGRQTLNA